MKIIANISAIAGVVLCAAAILIRLMGHPYIFGMEVLSLLNVGTALMVAACLAKLNS